MNAGTMLPDWLGKCAFKWIAIWIWNNWEYKNPEELELRQKQKGSSLIFNFFKFIQMWKNLKV